MRAQEPLPSGKPGDGGTFLPRSAARPAPSHFPTATPALPHRPSQPPLGWAGGFGQGARAPALALPQNAPGLPVFSHAQRCPVCGAPYLCRGGGGGSLGPSPGRAGTAHAPRKPRPPGWAPPSGLAHDPHHRRPSLPRQGPPAARRFWGKCKDPGTPWRLFQAWTTA